MLLREISTKAASIGLLVVAALAEIGGAYLVWKGVRDGGVQQIVLGVVALGSYGVLAALQPAYDFGRVLPAYGGVFIAGSIGWAMALDGFQPGRFDLAGAAMCLVGAATIMYAPR